MNAISVWCCRSPFLAPDIVEAIAAGTQPPPPPQLTATRLIRRLELPLDWEAQRQLLGFR